jgi:hypothetical protein
MDIRTAIAAGALATPLVGGLLAALLFPSIGRRVFRRKVTGGCETFRTAVWGLVAYECIVLFAMIILRIGDHLVSLIYAVTASGEIDVGAIK